jgi:NHLM bacteriocin system ABC transporter ATP-binding protein
MIAEGQAVQRQSTTIKENDPLVLNRRDICWVVQSGSMAVFVLSLADGRIDADRRYLFNAEPGDLLLGMELGEGRTLVAFAIEESTVTSYWLAEISEYAAQANPTFAAEIDGWVAKICPIASAFPAPAEVAEISSWGVIELSAGQYVRCSSLPVWVRAEAGTALLLGIQNAALQSGDVVPIGPGTWLYAQTPLVLRILQSGEVGNAAMIRQGLALLEQVLSHVLAAIERPLREQSVEPVTEAAPYTIKTNEPLPLNYRDTCWIVRSGSVGVYASTNNGDSSGNGWKYLFSAQPGQLLMGMESEDGRTVAAFAAEESAVAPYWLTDISEYAAQASPAVVAEINDWITNLCSVASTFPVPPDALEIPAAGVVEAYAGQYLKCSSGTIWVRADAGSARLLGMQDVTLQPYEIRPIGPGAWLYAETSIVLSVWQTDQLGDAASIRDGLAWLERGFFRMVTALDPPPQQQEQYETPYAYPQSYTIKGNEPLLLNRRDTCWIVRSGSMAVFATGVRDGQPEGTRRYLFGAEAGDLLMGMEPESDRILIAVAIEESQVYPYTLTEISKHLAQADFNVISQIEHWISKIGSVSFDFVCPSDAVEITGASPVEIQAGQHVRCARGRVRWLRTDSGYAQFLGMDDVTLQQSDVFPIAPGTWLHAPTDLVLTVLQTSQLGDAAAISDGLWRLEKGFFRVLTKLDRRQYEADRKRVAQRQELNAQVTKKTINDLATVAQPFETVGPSREGSPVVVVARIVAHELGLKLIVTPDDIESRDPLRAVAQSSDFRLRKVVLSGEWWRKDGGPLFAYLAEGQRPVALLPAKRSLLKRPSYEIFDPTDGSRTPLSLEKAGTLAPVAYTFYRPLPPKASGLELMKFALRGRGRDFVMILLAGLAVTALGMLTPLATGILFENAIPDGDKRLVIQLGLALGAAAVGSILFELTQSMTTLRIETGTTAALQSGVWDRLLKLSPPFFRQFSSGDLELRAEAMTMIRAQLSGATLHGIFAGLAALLNMGLMFSYSPTLASAALSISAVVLAIAVGTAVATKRRMKPATDMIGALFGIMVELITLVPKLRIAGAEERAFAHWGKAFSRQQKMMQSVMRTRDLMSICTGVLPLASSALLYWYAAESLHTPEAASLSVGVFLAFNVAFGTYLGGLMSLSQTGLGLMFVNIQWGRAKTILEAEPEVSTTKAHPGKLTGRVAVEHVTFRYRHDGPLTLDDVTLHAERGESIAIVGPSGSGKSTLLSLLLRFEVPESGAIYYDGQDLGGLDVHAVRRQLGVVMQDNKIMAGSIYDNIACGGVCTMDDAWEASRNAGLSDDLAQMPMGMHTMVSEGGGNISGGQRQRILIARALIFKPSILIFDEATSALDNNTQAIVTESLNRLQVTRFLVAHRLSTIRQANRIYVMEAGRIVQQGTFEELAAQPGLFAQLIARQTVGAVSTATA